MLHVFYILFVFSFFSLNNFCLAAEEIFIENSQYTGLYIGSRVAESHNNETQFAVEFTEYTTNVLSQFEERSQTNNAFVGYRFDDFFSIELEIGKSHFSNNAHTLLSVPTVDTTIPVNFEGDLAFGAVNINYGLINIVKEIDFQTFIRPYFSAGFGAAKVELQDMGIYIGGPIEPFEAGRATLINENDIAYTWQLGLGLILDITDHVALEAGYRYLEIQDIDVKTSTGNITSLNLSQNQLLVGMRLQF
jgi:opacity protein-like surface antigen